jgi:L-aminopeptidase/D-esterase-like protein
MTNDTLTAVPGIRVGHATHLAGATGCTVVLCPTGTVGGVDQRGGAPGTRETDLLRPLHHVETVNAIVLSGGSAFGLASADGVMRYLEERGEGYKTRSGYTVPIVAAAIVFDLAMGEPGIRPDAAMGYSAAAAASSDPIQQGTVGAGTGCLIGAMRGAAYATKGGVGSAAVHLDGNLVVAALCVVNAVGDVLDADGHTLAGLRREDGSFAGMLETMRGMARPPALSPVADGGENTVIGVIATNAKLSKDHVNKVAQMAQDGLARAVNPAHTMYDGDTLFALATGHVPADVNVIGAFAAEVTATAIRNAVRHAVRLGAARAWNE